MRRLIALVLALVVPGIACAQDAATQEQDVAQFKPFGEPVGNFTLLNLDGNYVSARDLRGHICVVQFFYPGCNECSKANPAMKRLQELCKRKTDVRLVSIALRYGEPELLKEFAKDQEANLDQWLFLSDRNEDRLHEIVRGSFFNMVATRKEPMPGALMDHSTKLLLIDSHGIILGYVEGTEEKAAETMAREIDRLRMAQRIPITAADLPRLNAILNATCTVLLLLGWITIRLRFETVHKILMLLALGVSAAFLTSYLFYHFAVLGGEPMRFRGTGAAWYAYIAILLSHTILAIVVAPLAIFITLQGLRDARMMHVRLARWTLPMWLYVSVTGVVVYWMLYRVEW